MKEKIKNIIDYSSSYSDLIPYLRTLKADGVSKEEVLCILKELRSEYQNNNNEEKEVYILDVMDIVVGYCNPADYIW